jgi:chromosome segregation ATPase
MLDGAVQIGRDIPVKIGGYTLRTRQNKCPADAKGDWLMKNSTILLLVLAILAGGAAIWMNSERGNALSQLQALRAELSKVKAEMAEAGDKITTLEKEKADLDAHASKLTEAQAALEKATKTGADAATARDAALAEVDKLGTQLAALEKKASEAAAALAKVSGERDTAQEALAAARSAREELEASIRRNEEAVQNQMAQLKTQLDSAQAAIATEKTARAQAEAQLETLRQARPASTTQ